jgi:uncharacterized Tic20 family protein
MIAVVAGLPLPIINLLATFIFYAANKKGEYFVRWHCTHALLSQLSLFIINCIGVWWTILIIFSSFSINNQFVAYIITIFVFNLIEFIATIYTAIQTRKGIHVEWWFFGSLTNIICKP